MTTSSPRWMFASVPFMAALLAEIARHGSIRPWIDPPRRVKRWKRIRVNDRCHIHPTKGWRFS